MAFAPPPIEIREVWSENLESEFLLIRSLVDDFPFVALDTEFPGIVFKPSHGDRGGPLPPLENYFWLKQNVDALKIIQCGLTLADSDGNLPDLGNPKCGGYIWQFNFKDFDISTDTFAVDSIELLKKNGMDFELTRRIGVDSVKFAELLMSSGLVCNDDGITWVTFHCSYDFGYMVKVLTQSPLPSELGVFLQLVEVFFGGGRVFDVKRMTQYCDGVFGGLEKIAQVLKVERVGLSHTAGSDSLLTWNTFERIRDIIMMKHDSIEQYAGLLYGLVD